MRKRLYFMLPDVEHCKQLVNELQKVSVLERDIHVIAHDNIPLDDLPQATALQKTELAHGLELGTSVGGAAGMLGGILAMAFPPAGIVLGGGAVIAAMTLAGASFGGIVSYLIASDIPNHELEGFQTGIAQGQILLILDILTKRVAEITQLIKTTHPEAKIGMVNSVKA